MDRRRLLIQGAALAGAAGAVVAARRAAAQAAADEIYDWSGPTSEPTDYGVARGGAPVTYHQAQSFATFHAAALDAVRDALPSSDLHPVRLGDGRAVVLVDALRYHEITAHGVYGLAALPYGEVMVAALVTRRPAPPLLPLLLPRRTGLAAGGFILHLPVTTRAARDAGRLGWGMPKFVADMEFHDSLSERRVRVEEGGRTVLELIVRPAGRPTIEKSPLVLYSVLGGQLIETRAPAHGIRQLRWGAGGGSLRLGDHQVAEDLSRFDISPAPFIAISMVGQRVLLPLGEAIGPARPYLGYIGEERDLGRYVVRHPHTAPIDQYAPFAATVGPARTVEALAAPVSPPEAAAPSVEGAAVRAEVG